MFGKGRRSAAVHPMPDSNGFMKTDDGQETRKKSPPVAATDSVAAGCVDIDASKDGMASVDGVDALIAAFASLESTIRTHVAFMEQLKLKSIPVAANATATAAVAHPIKPSRKKTKRHSLLCVANSTDDSSIKRADKVVVSVRVIFFRVGEIDTLRDRFHGDVLIQARWREPLLDNSQRMKLQWTLVSSLLHCLTYSMLSTIQPPEDKDLENSYWIPKLYVANTYGEGKESRSYSVSYNGINEAMITEKIRLNALFFEFMELNRFPFDSQDLTVTVSSERQTSEIELIADPNDRSIVNIQSFVDEQEWKLDSRITTWTKTQTSSFRNTQTIHPIFSAACKTYRKPGFFIYNIFVVMFLICSMAFGTFSVQLNLPQNRLQLSFILLLTTVSFKFVVNQSLPMISYLTYLDKYILGSMGILCLVCIWHAIIPFIQTRYGSSLAQFVDTIALVVLAVTYIILHIVLKGAVASLNKWSKQAGNEFDMNDNISQNVNQSSSETDINHVGNGDMVNTFNEPIDNRGGRNLIEAATNQTVMSAWQ